LSVTAGSIIWEAVDAEQLLVLMGSVCARPLEWQIKIMTEKATQNQKYTRLDSAWGSGN